MSVTIFFFFCLATSRVKSYQDFINQAGLCQQSSIILTPKHHKRYIFPDEETTDDFGQPTSRYHSSSLSAEEECCSQFRSVAQATTMESPSLYVREMLSTLQSPQQFSRQGNLSFIRNSNNRKPENERRAASPLHFSLTRLGSLLKRSPSPSNSSANRRYPSEPRRSVSLSTNAEKDRSKEFEQYSSKSKRLFKALLSMRNPRKDSALYKFLDEN